MPRAKQGLLIHDLYTAWEQASGGDIWNIDIALFIDRILLLVLMLLESASTFDNFIDVFSLHCYKRFTRPRKSSFLPQNLMEA